MSTVTIEQVTDKNGIMELVKFPFKLYKGDPNWVPPFIEERRDFFDPKKNPFYEHARFQLFLARRDGERPAIAGDGLLLPPLVLESNAQVVVCLGIAWLQLQRPALHGGAPVLLHVGPLHQQIDPPAPDAVLALDVPAPVHDPLEIGHEHELRGDLEPLLIS
jgi:hypothetical protein